MRMRLRHGLGAGARGFVVGRLLPLAALLWAASASAWGETGPQEPASGPAVSAPGPKYGPDAVPLPHEPGYLRTHPAPDFWTLIPHYVPQAGNSACSLASVAMLVNALRGVPPPAEAPYATQASVLAAVGSETWARETAEGGPGVRFAEFEGYVRQSLRAFGVETRIEVFRPEDDGPAALAELRRWLRENERSARDIALVYFNQGTLTGDWNGPHISPIGAYDAERRAVLVLDVDREWYVPYWSSDAGLLRAMLRPRPRESEPGGLIRVRLAGD